MRVVIIGGAGGMGRWLVNHFLEQNHTIVVADPAVKEPKEFQSEIEIAVNTEDAVKNSDVVIISVPMQHTAEVIMEVAPHMKKNSVLCEISTLKLKVIEVLRNVSTNQIRPLCIHPLFGPGATAIKKKFALIPTIELEEEKKLVKSLFPNSQIIVVEADDHDRIMALTLSLPYFMNMILASVLNEEDFTLIEQLSGTTFAVQFMLIGSIMSHTSAFHLAVHRENKYALEILRKLQSRITEYLELISNGTDIFEQSFSSIKSLLEEKLDLKGKYREMYRLLKVMEEQKGEDLEL